MSRMFFLNHGDNRIIKCVEIKESLGGAVVTSRGEKRSDADVLGSEGPTSTNNVTSGSRKSRRDRNKLKEENDLTNFEVREIMERPLSSRESSIGRTDPSRSRSREGNGRMSESTEERSHNEDGSRSEEVSLRSGGKKSRKGSGRSREGSGRSREGSGQWTAGGGRSSGNNSRGSRKSCQSESERQNSSEKQESDVVLGTTGSDGGGISNSVRLKGEDATSPGSKGGGKVRDTTKALSLPPSEFVRSAAVVSSSAVPVDRFYDITSIMTGRGVFRVGGGGSFKGEVTKTAKEEDSYIGGDDDDEDPSIAESIVRDSSTASANVNVAKGQVGQQTACAGSKASINTSSPSIDHSSNINNNIFTSFDRHSSSAVTATLTLRESRIITSDVVSGEGGDIWGQFMAADWFSGVLDSSVGGAPLEYDDDDSSVLTDAEGVGKGRGSFKSAVRSCLCTPWRVPAAHM